MGGIGVTSECILASSASLGSTATHSLSNTPFSGSKKGAEDHAVRSATTTWKSLTQSSLPVEATKRIKKAWETPVESTVYQKVLTDDTNIPTDTARLTAVAASHAEDWFHVPPITAVNK